MAASPVPNLPSGYVFRPNGQELIEHYLVPKALGGYVIPGLVAEGVDVFSAAPDALPFSRNHQRDDGEVWGYFFGAHATAERATVPAPGGRWFPYGSEKAYGGGNGVGEAVAFRRRFRYHVMSQGGGDGDGDGSEVWASTPWLMTEFRLNKGAAAFRCAPPGAKANMDCVVRKVFTKPPAQSAEVPSGVQIIKQYLGPRALHGKLPKCVTPGFVAEEVDVFAVSPDALPFPPSHREQNGEVWGYFFAAKPTTSMHLAHGGCWMQYGGEKKYGKKCGEVVAFRRRFAFHAAARVDSHGMVVAWMRTRWLMKEYRMAPSIRKANKGPGANMDLVVLKVFTQPPTVPPQPEPASWFNYHGMNQQGAGRSIAGGPSATAFRSIAGGPSATAFVASCLSP